MALTFDARRFRGTFIGLLLIGGLLVVPRTSPIVTASASPPVFWNQVGRDLDGEAGGDGSGWSVAMSSDGTTVIIGAPFNGGNGRESGHARVYRFDSAVWVQVGNDIDGEALGDESGGSVAMSGDGNTVIIGATGNDGNGDRSGHARVYQFDGTDWVQVGGDIDGEARGDSSGFAVAMSGDGNTVIIGAPQNGLHGTAFGHVRVYRFDGTNWVQVGGDIDGEASGDQSGRAVATSGDGDTVIIGAPTNDGNGDRSGHARVYRFDGTDWVQVGADLDGEAVRDLFGWSVALSSDGNAAIIGARWSDGNVGYGSYSGQSRVYRVDGTDWVQVGADINGEAYPDESGWSVAMSSDGSTVVVGAHYNGGNGGFSGHARVYRFDGTDWIQVGADIDGAHRNDFSGWSVAMSSDGSTVVIGAPNPYTGDHPGHSRVFEAANQTRLVCDDVAGTADEVAAAGYNVIIGTSGDDFLPGTAGNDFILGLDGNDLILAGMGDDVVCGGASHDRVVGGDGVDSLHGEAGNDRVWGGTGDDYITGGPGKDVLVGGDGDDGVSGDGADDTIRGGRGDDVLRGGDGKDDIGGDVGNDTLFGGALDDVLRGHDGVDVCDGGTRSVGDQAFSCETLINIP